MFDRFITQTFTSACIGYGLSRQSPTLSREQRYQTPPPNTFQIRVRNRDSDSISEDSIDSDAPIGGATQLATPIMNIHSEWGEVVNLRGLISSLTIFGDSLSASHVKTLYRKGE